MEIKSPPETLYDCMITKYTYSDGGFLYLEKVPYEVLKEAYDDLVFTLVDLKGLARLMHTCEQLYIYYRDSIPLTMSYHVATYLLNTVDKEKKAEYNLYYQEIMEKLSYEVNLQNYIKG